MLIDKIYKNTENKDGKPYVTKTGKPYVICNIQINGDWVKFADFFGASKEWSAGMDIDLKALGFEIVETEWNGKPQLELKKINKENALEKRIAALERAASIFKEEILGLKQSSQPNSSQQLIGAIPSDLPF